jgi:aspartate aminotransferase-like enzyme
MNPSRYRFKLATEAEEFEQIHRLNYRTFVEEIPQHAPSASGRLVDRFHEQNRYCVALEGTTVVGMLALRPQRPFSLDAKIPDLDTYLPAGAKPIEVRLLAVSPLHRQGPVLAGLLRFATRSGWDGGYDVAVISGTTRQLRLYRHLGFVPFGPLVGESGARYQPMYLTLRAFGQTVERSVFFQANRPDEVTVESAVNLLPGPVSVSPEVQAALMQPTVSHRTSRFTQLLGQVRTRLCQLACARDVQVLPGSGSLANAVVAGQLSLLETPGLVLANGEFGDRLLDEARRQGLFHATLRLAWGTPFDLAEIEARARNLPPGGWLWFVHHETSTGMLNPLPELKRLCLRRGWRLAVDCVSSLGALPVDLSDVYLASSTSGKGLGAFPGLALVFHDYVPRIEVNRLPAYLDLGHWAAHDSVPFTQSSNLIMALAEAVRQATAARMAEIAGNARWLRATLRAEGLTLAADERNACAGALTIKLGAEQASCDIGEEMERRGFLLSFRSRHLRERRWLQISLLGNPPRSALVALVHELRQALSSLPESAPSQARLAVPSVFPTIA